MEKTSVLMQNDVKVVKILQPKKDTITLKELLEVCAYDKRTEYQSLERALRVVNLSIKDVYTKDEVFKFAHKKGLVSSRKERLINLYNSLSEPLQKEPVKVKYVTVNDYICLKLGLSDFECRNGNIHLDAAKYFMSCELDYKTKEINNTTLKYYNYDQLNTWFETYGKKYDIVEKGNDESLLTRDLLDTITFFKLEIQREVEDNQRRYDLVINDVIYEVKKDPLTLTMIADKLDKAYPKDVVYIAPKVDPKSVENIGRLGVKVKTFEEFFTEFEQKFQLANLSKKFYDIKKRQFMSRWVV
jgi:hypothetical protein